MKIRDFEKFVKKLLKNIHSVFKSVGYTQLLIENDDFKVSASEGDHSD